MKGGFAAAALAALAGGVSAAHHRHGHDNLFAKRGNETGEICVPGCTTIWTTITGAPTLVPIATTTATLTNTSTTTVTFTEAHKTTVTAPPPPPVTTAVIVVPVPVPTPQPHTCPTPGTYTFSATTITVNQTTTVCRASSTQVPSGTHTVGGVTTVVKTATTVICPVATVATSGTVTTSTILQTTYVCPTPGTYTIAPHTTTVTEATVIVYPVPTSYNPGTYTAPQQVVTVTETDYVTYCPFTSVGLPTTSAAPAPAPQTTKVAPPPPPPASTAAPTSTQSQTPPAQSSVPASANPGGLTSNNDHFGITYTPYEASNGQCKPSSQVDSDIAELKAAGFTTVRVYSTDCHTLEYVGNACQKHGVDMIVGVFVKGSGCSYDSPDIKEQVDALAAWDKWSLVKLVVVGNEAIMNGFCSPQQLRGLITTVKSKCSQYTGPYTISETLNIWQRSDVSSAICDVVGVTGANIHPYFNSDVTPDSAGDFVAGQLELLSQICKGNEVINLECGWPTRGSCNGKACPGKTEQASAIKSMRAKTGSKTVFFSFEDDLWKEAGSCGCEQSWGAASSFQISVDINI
ncbi:putative beta-glucosidase btgE [Tolypocladium ophioglossoides CBS 100239]|uniref:Probable beta-glucosidase btgE n=1 Tax=Tolypocladium ophioglossoides (strain CBS 100239) TaxID=1163406 RepID=A0A0L0N8D0_TOLOC|nr:putative beta-glucosidase btgE [Tolypocladium ophioglossoides CBS 100239]